MFETILNECLETIVNTCTHVRSGVEANFYKINNEVGLKLFHYESTRDETWENQKKGHEAGIATKVGPKVIVDGKPGYLIEICPHVIQEEICEMAGVPWRKGWFNKGDTRQQMTAYQQSEIEWKEAYQEERDNLFNRVVSLYGNWNDCHWGNIGLMGDGTMVVIDWGRMS